MIRRLAKWTRELRDLPADLALLRRTEGWKGVAAELRERTLHRVWRRGRFLVFSQGAADIRDVPPPGGVGIAPVADADWAALAAIVPRARLARFREWVARGRVMLVARRGERAVGYTWYSDRMEPDVEFYDLALPPGATYGWALYVVPAERNGGVGSALVAARLRHARDRGFTSYWRIVNVRNVAAQRTVDKSANPRHRVRIGELTWTKLFGRSRTTFHPYEGGTS